MTREEIEKIRERKQAAFDRQYREFQQSGYSKAWTRARGYQEIVDICDQALNSAKDHTDALHLRADMLQLAREADEVLQNWACTDILDVQDVSKHIRTYGEMYGYSSPWR